MRNIDFKDTDKKIKECIYGIEFEINTKELEKIDTKEISEDSNLDEILEKILGQGACDKLNKVRKENGYEEMDAGVELAIFLAIITDYVDSRISPVTSTMDNIQNKFDRMNNYKNRNQRRNNNYRGNRHRGY